MFEEAILRLFLAKKLSMTFPALTLTCLKISSSDKDFRYQSVMLKLHEIDNCHQFQS